MVEHTSHPPCHKQDQQHDQNDDQQSYESDFHDYRPSLEWVTSDTVVDFLIPDP
jgi:hypothetical protein